MKKYLMMTSQDTEQYHAYSRDNSDYPDWRGVQHDWLFLKMSYENLYSILKLMITQTKQDEDYYNIANAFAINYPDFETMETLGYLKNLV